NRDRRKIRNGHPPARGRRAIPLIGSRSVALFRSATREPPRALLSPGTPALLCGYAKPKDRKLAREFSIVWRPNRTGLVSFPHPRLSSGTARNPCVCAAATANSASAGRRNRDRQKIRTGAPSGYCRRAILLADTCLSDRVQLRLRATNH